MNTVALTDVYNTTHNAMKKCDFDVSYIYNRTSPMIMFGFEEHVRNIFSKPITNNDIKQLDNRMDGLGVWFDRDVFETVIAEFDGYLPLNIKSIPSGSYIPKGTPFCEISNTVKGFGDLVTWWEPRLLKGFWGCCAATRAWKISEYLKSYNLPNNLIHNFAFRSYPSDELGIIADEAWALFLEGSDGLHSRLKYNIKSIPAAAHKIMQKFDNEVIACKHIIDVVKSKGINIVAVPIDTYNSQNFINNVLPQVQIYAQKNNITVIYRIDSGDTRSYALQFIEREIPHIISDGVDFQFIRDYHSMLGSLSLPLNLTYFGMGYGWFKDFSRDMLGWAMKTAWADDKDIMKFSNDRFKQSLPGKLDVVFDNQNRSYNIIPHYEKGRNEGSMYVGLYYVDKEYKYIFEDDLLRDINFNRKSLLDMTVNSTLSISDDINKKIISISDDKLYSQKLPS